MNIKLTKSKEHYYILNLIWLNLGYFLSSFSSMSLYKNEYWYVKHIFWRLFLKFSQFSTPVRILLSLFILSSQLLNSASLFPQWYKFKFWILQSFISPKSHSSSVKMVQYWNLIFSNRLAVFIRLQNCWLLIFNQTNVTFLVHFEITSLSLKNKLLIS